MEGLMAFWAETGIAHFEAGQLLMMGVGCLLLYLAIARGFEPLLLLPIGFGAILTNIPEIGLALSPIEKLIYFSNVFLFQCCLPCSFRKLRRRN